MYAQAVCGTGAVAEMTGRRGRVVADARGRGIYELRAKPDSTEMDSLNVSETGNAQHHCIHSHAHMSGLHDCARYQQLCRVPMTAMLYNEIALRSDGSLVEV